MGNIKRTESTYEIPPRVMVGAPSGRSGKTIVSVGLCDAFRKRGLSIQPFKKGPDYIDASWLSAASNKSCRNLDAFLMSEATLLKSFEQTSIGSDLVIIEGNMGLYDGIDKNGRGSSAHLARMIRTPVILVINTERVTRSVAALVNGYKNFEPDTPIAGVILNNVSGQRHKAKLVDAIERYCKIPVLGAIPRDAGLNITERHLGLIPFRESISGLSAIEHILRVIKGCMDIDGILSIARSAERYFVKGEEEKNKKEINVRIGVLFDQVFNFYYPENLEMLMNSGAELLFIDSIKDTRLPRIEGLYIGGGFPELFSAELEANKGLRHEIALAIEGGLPVYAECAGLTYLCRGIRWQGRRYEMVGAIPADIEICKRPQGHGYVEVEVGNENPFFPLGSVLRGHEFHHSKLLYSDDLKFAYKIKRGHGIDGKVDGVFFKNLFAAYTHLHALSVPQWAEGFVSLILKQKKRYAHSHKDNLERRSHGNMSRMS